MEIKEELRKAWIYWLSDLCEDPNCKLCKERIKFILNVLKDNGETK